MFTEVFAETSKSVKFVYRNKLLVVLALLPPIALSIIFIQAFTFTSGAGFPLAVVNYDTSNHNNWTSNLIKSLESEKGTIPYFKVTITSEQDALDLFNQRKTFAVLYIPSTFSQDIEEGEEVFLMAKINTIHEDISKNLRLGLEGRIYQFIITYQLEDGVRPGITVDSSLLYPEELKRADYMISGIFVVAMMWFGFGIGGFISTEEKQRETWKEIIMADQGTTHVKLGKILATLVISTGMMLIILLFEAVLYDLYFIELGQIIVFWTSFLLMVFIFGTIGVSWGLKIGDIRAVPAPAIIITLTFWMVGGAINPLEFSAGSEVFKLLPSAAVIRLLTTTFFNRGAEYIFESVFILLIWIMIATLSIIIPIVKERVSH